MNSSRGLKINFDKLWWPTYELSKKIKLHKKTIKNKSNKKSGAQHCIESKLKKQHQSIKKWNTIKSQIRGKIKLPQKIIENNINKWRPKLYEKRNLNVKPTTKLINIRKKLKHIKLISKLWRPTYEFGLEHLE